MEKSCLECSATFEITDEDLKFYQKVSPKIGNQVYEIPPPRLCPDCRQQRRLSWRNERKLYPCKCAGTGKAILSVYNEKAIFPVFDPEYWHSDAWNALSYGREFDFNKPFFLQFQDLMNSVPQLARSVDKNQNSEFTNQCGWSKDCYLIFEAEFNDSCWYSSYIYDSRFCSDCVHVINSELCYECVDCQNCYKLRFSQNCKNCHSSWFLKNCIGCSNCYGSVNLYNKQYYFNNQKYAKDEYEQKLQNISLSEFSNLQELATDFLIFSQNFPHKFMSGVQNEDSVGDYLNNTQRCEECFDLNNAQDCKWVFDSRNTKNVYDMTVFGSKDGAELCYENHEIGSGVQNILFSDQIWIGCHDIIYSKLCIHNSRHCFGCIGLKHANFCILNKQYTKEEYEKLIPRIIEHMQKTGEWGEFFPVTLSPFAYNETVAQSYFPLSREQALEKGWKWRDEEDSIPSVKKIIPADKLPETIQEVPDDILNWAIRCEKTEKPFKIQKAELDFYRKMNLPIPHFHPDERHENRMQKRNPRKLWDRNCAKCGINIKTTYAPERPEKILCEKCYLEEIN